MLSRGVALVGRRFPTGTQISSWEACRTSKKSLYGTNLKSKSSPSRLGNFFLKRAHCPTFGMVQIRSRCSKQFDEDTRDRDMLERMKEGLREAETKAPVNSNFIPDTMADLDTMTTVDESLAKTVTDEPMEPTEENLKGLVYRAFLRHGNPPTDMESFKAMENKAMEAIHLMSTSKDVHVIRELALLARNQFEQVLTASSNHAASPNLIFHLGLACSMLKDWKATEECMFTVLQHDPGLVPAKRYLADAFHAQHKYMEAVHYYDEFFNDFPKYYGRAIRDDGTIPDLVGNSTTVDSESILADVIFSRGKSYFAMKEYGSDFAKEDFKAVVRMNAKHKAHSLLFLGMLESRGKDYWKAIKYFDLALQTGPAHWAMYKERADAWRALEKEERALDDERHADLLKRQLHWSNQIESKQEHDVIPEFKIDRYLDGAAITQPNGKSMR